MGFLVPVGAAIIGGAAGTAIAGAIGLGAIGTTIAGAVGASLVGAALSGGIDNFFDDPMSALVSIGMSTILPGLQEAGWTAFKNVDPSTFGGKMLQGINAATKAVGTVYDGIGNVIGSAIDGLSDATGGGLFNMKAAVDAGDFDVVNFDDPLRDFSGMGDQIVAETNRLNIQSVNADPFNLTGSGGLKGFEPSLGPLDSPDAPGAFFDAQKVDGEFVVGPNREAINELEAQSAFPSIKQEDLFQEFSPQALAEKRSKGPSLGLSATIQSQAIPQFIPPGGSPERGTLEGAGGQSGILSQDELFNNPVVRPMREAFERQQQRMSQIAERTWGLLAPQRAQGLMS